MRHITAKTASKTAPNDHLHAYRLVMLGFLTIAIYMMLASPAHAFYDTLCNLANIAQTTFARGLATLGIIAVGVGATLGKVSWTMAITVAVGISVVMSAGWIAGTLAPTVTCTGVPNGAIVY